MAPVSIRDGLYPSQGDLFLWYKLRPPLQDVTDEEEIKDVITELDVMYGDGKPWYDFEKVKPEVSKGIEGKTDSVWLTYRKGVNRAFPLT